MLRFLLTWLREKFITRPIYVKDMCIWQDDYVRANGFLLRVQKANKLRRIRRWVHDQS